MKGSGRLKDHNSANVIKVGMLQSRRAISHKYRSKTPELILSCSVLVLHSHCSGGGYAMYMMTGASAAFSSSAALLWLLLYTCTIVRGTGPSSPAPLISDNCLCLLLLPSRCCACSTCVMSHPV
jgi:hypothetical protein